MRFGYTLLLAGALSLGIGIQAQADDFIPQKAGNVTISLPSGWEVLPKGVLKQFSQENGPEILLLAQGPADDFLKLSIIRNPDPGTQEAFLKQDAAQTEKNCKKLIGELESQLGTGKAEATCGKVENNGVAALATQLAIPAQDNRPELINMTWVYPNGDKGVIARTPGSTKPTSRRPSSPSSSTSKGQRQPLPEFGNSGAAFSPAEAAPRAL